MRGGLLRAAFGVACMTVAAGFAMSAAQAQTYGGDSGSAWSSLMHAFGMNRQPDPDANIRYDERSPLVVPPSRELPQPVAAVPRRRPTGRRTPELNHTSAPRQRRRSILRPRPTACPIRRTAEEELVQSA